MILDAWFWAGTAVGVLSLLVCLAMTALRTHPADASILSVAAVELFLLVYGGVGPSASSAATPSTGRAGSSGATW